MTAPTVADFQPGEKYLIQFFDYEPDKLGRRQFFLYWLADNCGYSIQEFGVRGQAFFTNPARFNARVIV